MQQALDRRPPSARFRSHLREIPLQRRYGVAGSGETNSWVAIPRDLDEARDERRTEDIEAGSPAIPEPEVLAEPGPDRGGQALTGAEVPADVELSAAPPAEPLEAIGEADEAHFIRKAQDGRPEDQGVDRVDQLTVDVAGDHPHAALASDDHPAEEGGPTAVVPTAGPLLSGEGPVVSDQAWEWMAALLPSSTGRRGGQWRDHRQVVEAIGWKYRTGTPWRELPARFGPWQTAYERLTRWRADGTWARLLAQARIDADAAAELEWLVAVDPTVVRAHQPGPSARPVDGTAATASSDAPEDGAAA
jgi:transposase